VATELAAGPSVAPSEIEHGGKVWRRNQYGDVDVWRLSSRKTGRWHWVSVRKPPAAVLSMMDAVNGGLLLALWAASNAALVLVS